MKRKGKYKSMGREWYINQYDTSSGNGFFYDVYSLTGIHNICPTYTFQVHFIHFLEWREIMSKDRK